MDSLVEELDETAGRLVERDKETSWWSRWWCIKNFTYLTHKKPVRHFRVGYDYNWKVRKWKDLIYILSTNHFNLQNWRTSHFKFHCDPSSYQTILTNPNPFRIPTTCCLQFNKRNATYIIKRIQPCLQYWCRLITITSPTTPGSICLEGKALLGKCVCISNEPISFWERKRKVKQKGHI